MNEDEVLTKLEAILQSLLGDASIKLAARTTRADVPGWDSFAYVNFIVAVETEFGIRFQLAEVESFETVGEIARAVVALKS